MPTPPLELLRHYRQIETAIIRGEIPNVEDKPLHPIAIQIFFCIFIFGSSWLAISLLLIFTLPWGYAPIANRIGFGMGFMLVNLFLFWPVGWAIYRRYKTGYPLDETEFNSLSAHHTWLKPTLIRYQLLEPAPVLTDETQDTKQVIPALNQEPIGFRLWLGTSTGLLATLWHRAGMAAHQQVLLNQTDACQNILVLGGLVQAKRPV